MSGVICVDFGTSSLRAVRRDPNGNRRVLDIGRVTGSKSIDEASIRCEIHIDATSRVVRYGEKAVQARSKLPLPALYEASAKLWLKDPGSLDTPVLSSCKVTRRDLITGLLAFALFAANQPDAKNRNGKARAPEEIRIAHPVWESQIEAQANKALLEMGWVAAKMALERDWGEVDISTLVLHTVSHRDTGSLRQKSDVIEPIAAALELLPTGENIKRVCVVIDVGAGTTDIGVFQSLTPDDRSNVSEKLIPLCPSKSVFRAGNEIDRIVLKLLEKKVKVKDKAGLEDVKSRIRDVKKFLFDNKFIQELGVRLELSELEADADIVAMASEIRVQLENSLRDKPNIVRDWVRDPFYGTNILEIVMAGGGGEIKFLHQALKRPICINGQKLDIRITSPSSRSNLQMFGASFGRLAVALGGANEFYDDLKHEHEKLTARPSLGKAKQKISNDGWNSQAIPLAQQGADSITRLAKPQNFDRPIYGDAIKGRGEHQLPATKSEEKRRSNETQDRKLTEMIRKAEAGEAGTQFQLAREFAKQINEANHIKETYGWYFRAARQGHISAQISLGVYLATGRGTDKKVKEAYFWWLVATMQKHGTSKELAFAKRNLEKIQGEIISSDKKIIKGEAMEWRPILEISNSKMQQLKDKFNWKRS